MDPMGPTRVSTDISDPIDASSTPSDLPLHFPLIAAPPHQLPTTTVMSSGISVNAHNVLDEMPHQIPFGDTTTTNPRSNKDFEYTAPEGLNGKAMRVRATKEDEEKEHPYWSKCIVGYFIGPNLGLPTVDSMARHYWGKALSETSLHGDFFMFHIPDDGARQTILERGDWMFSGQPIVLQQWTPKITRKELSKLPVWVKFLDIPLAMWTREGIGRIASGVGVPLYCDAVTAKFRGADFARVCVKVDAAKPVPETIELILFDEVHVIRLEYQTVIPQCTKCGVFGHKCSTNVQPGRGGAAESRLATGVDVQALANSTHAMEEALVGGSVATNGAVLNVSIGAGDDGGAFGTLIDCEELEEIVEEKKTVVEEESMDQGSEEYEDNNSHIPETPIMEETVEDKVALPPPTTKRRRRSGSPVVPTDLVFSILSRVPVRSLSRFRSVSKSWNSLILDPFFRRSHHPRTRILIANRCTYASLDPSNSTLIPIDSSDCLNLCCCRTYPGSYPIKSCRGLICFYLITSGLCVLNPATGEYLKSPESYLYSSGQVLGFAYVASAGEYKILCETTQPTTIPTIRDEDHRYCVFSFGGKLGVRWSAVKGNRPFSISEWQTVTAKGVVYMRLKGIYITVDIVRFNMETEEWSVMPSPPEGEVSVYDNVNIQELSDSLCYTRYSWWHRTFDMWILKDCDVWEEFKIDISTFNIRRGLLVDIPLHLLVIDNNGRMLFRFYFWGENDCDSELYYGLEDYRYKLVYYCPKSKRFEDVYRNENRCANLIVPYDETFASPFGDVSTI